MKQELEIISIQFAPEGLTLSYGRPNQDIRVGGHVMMQHMVMITGGDYEDEIDDLYRTATRLLRDVLEDFESSDPVTTDDTEPDDERGMGER